MIPYNHSKHASPDSILLPAYTGKVFIQGFEMGWEQDGSRMIVACETHAYILGGSGGIPPNQENLNPLRLLLTQSGTKFPNNILMTHTYYVQYNM